MSIKHLILALTLVVSALGAAMPVITAAAVLPTYGTGTGVGTATATATATVGGGGGDGAGQTSVSCIQHWCQDGVSMCLYWGGVTSWDVSLGPIPGMTQTVFEESCTANAARRAAPTSPFTDIDYQGLPLTTVTESHARSTKTVPSIDFQGLTLTTITTNNVDRRAVPTTSVVDIDFQGLTLTTITAKVHEETTKTGTGIDYQGLPLTTIAVNPADRRHATTTANKGIDYQGLSLTTLSANATVSPTPTTPADSTAETTTSSSSSVFCYPTYCQEGTRYCHYWAGVTGWDASQGVVPGMQRTSIGECASASASATDAVERE